jgi:hypothetical protein
VQRPGCGLLRGAQSPHGHRGDSSSNVDLLAQRNEIAIRIGVNVVYYRNTALSSRITAFLTSWQSGRDEAKRLSRNPGPTPGAPRNCKYLLFVCPDQGYGVAGSWGEELEFNLAVWPDFIKQMTGILALIDPKPDKPHKNALLRASMRLTRWNVIVQSTQEVPNE